MQVKAVMESATQTPIRKDLDQRGKAFHAATPLAQKPAGGWLRAVRQAVGFKQQTLAKKIGVSRQSYADLESSEARGAISLNSLTRAAEGMDCKLVYFLVPRGDATFESLAQAHDAALKHLHASEHSMALEGQPACNPRPKSPS